MNILQKCIIPAGSSGQTHMWFDDSRKLLQMNEIQVEHVRNALFLLVEEHGIDKVMTKTCQKKWNALSEKISKDANIRMFIDLDWSVDQIDSDTFEDDLKELLQALNDAMEELVGNQTRMVVSMRLIYKLHVHFPDVVVDLATAKVVHQFLDDVFKHTTPDLYGSKVMDKSVYNTGLRVLYCHKGKLQKPEKFQNEYESHVAKFGNTYKHCYRLIDLETLQPLEPALEHLEWTSIRTMSKETTKLPGLANRSIVVSKKHSGSSGKAKAVASESSDLKDLEHLVTWIQDEYKIKLNGALKVFKDNHTLTFGTTGQQKCHLADRCHSSNNIYIKIDEKKGVRQMCHDPDCKGKEHNLIAFEKLPVDAQNDFRKSFVIKYNHQQKLEMFENQVQTSCKQEHPRNSFELDYNAANIDKYGLMAKLNDLYCAKCNKEHEDPQTFIMCNLDGQVMLKCLKQLWQPAFDLTTLPTIITQNVFQGIVNITVNNTTVNNYQADQSYESEDFGTMEDFPSIMDDRELDMLLYASLSGHSGDISDFLVPMMKGKFICVQKVWYKYIKNRWKVCSGPDLFINREFKAIYKRLLNIFTDAKQVKWLKSLIRDLGNHNLRRPIIEDARITMEDDDICLNRHSHLIPFQNGVFDTQKLEVVPHSYEYYMTDVLPYELPSQSDPQKRSEINKFFEDILPNQEVRKCLLQYLGMHLDGTNRHQKIAILTGPGGNGKGKLKELMGKVLRHLHTEPSATFLTSERPSDEKPAANLVNLRNKFSVWSSEPETSKKINGAFIKFLSGNDPVKCRALNANDYIEYVPKFLITLLCNAIPVIDGAQDDVRAIRRRLLIVNFPTNFVDPSVTNLKPNEKYLDHSLARKIDTWVPEMMLYLIEIYRDYVNSGYVFNVPDCVKQRVADELEELNPLQAFLDECLVPQPRSVVHVHKVAKAYEAYLRERDIHRTIKTASMRMLLEGANLRVSDDNRRISDCCNGITRCLLDHTLRE